MPGVHLCQIAGMLAVTQRDSLVRFALLRSPTGFLESPAAPVIPSGDPPFHIGGRWCSLEPFVPAGHRSSPPAAPAAPLGASVLVGGLWRRGWSLVP